MSPSDAGTVLLSNADGVQVTAGREVLDRLVTQVSNPVRWDACMEAMTALGVTHLIELAPAGTLVGLAKRVSLLSTGPTDTATDATGGNIAEVMATEPNDVVADVDVESVKVDL